MAALSQRGAVYGNGPAEASHGDLVKTFTSFGLRLSTTFTAKSDGPIISVAADYGDRIGWVGCNCQGRYIGACEGKLFRTREEVTRLIASYEECSATTTSQFRLTRYPVNALEVYRSAFKQEPRCSINVVLAPCIRRTGCDQSAERNEEKWANETASQSSRKSRGH